MRKLLGTLFWLIGLGAIALVAQRLKPSEELRFWLLFPAVGCVCGLIGVWVHERRPK